MNPILYYLCGYRSTSRSSPKFAHFQHSLSAVAEVRALDYPGSHEPMICRDYFLSQTEAARPVCFMGASLGGFWANWLANYWAAPCILLNPCCHPSDFAARLPQEDKVWADFVTLESDILHPALPRLLFLAQDDNVLDYRQQSKLFLLQVVTGYGAGCLKSTRASLRFCNTIILFHRTIYLENAQNKQPVIRTVCVDSGAAGVLRQKRRYLHR